MTRITRNEHIVNLQGTSVHQNQIFLLLEFCAFGSVASFLKHNASYYRQCISNNDYEFLLRCCTQVASGMDFLVGKEVIHSDLAARNVLITSDMTIKLADFGLSQRMYMKLGDRKGPRSEKVPVLYSAIEVLRADHAVLEYSDVWSYAVYVWEIFQLCLAKPYVGVSGGKLKKRLLR